MDFLSLLFSVLFDGKLLCFVDWVYLMDKMEKADGKFESPMWYTACISFIHTEKKHGPTFHPRNERKAGDVGASLMPANDCNQQLMQ
ncbi:hypothetical protein CSKR_106217 [Clonorchis sinensis]|uniref:Uncharacterized protein n=1 Tax=Clonorchis sinensis TaxID=79923 RepID=A0A419PU10_CLOSI|nr:hypothetical protein CSKR_106217 [Clonorchis sinensis]